MSLKIGIVLDSLQIPYEEGIEVACEAGVEGIQFFAAPHHMAFKNNARADVHRIAKLARSRGLEIPAICGDLDGFGYERREDNRRKIPRTKEIIDTADEIGTRIISTHIGVIGSPGTEKRAVMLEALQEICSYAEGKNILMAIETGPDPAAFLYDFIRDVGSPGLRVNFDPANLKMVHNEEADEAVEIFQGLIVHTHAKDGNFYQPCNPQAVYDAFAAGNPDHIDISSFFTEELLGCGQIRWKQYLAALQKIGYSGFLTIEREDGDNRIAEILEEVRFLKQLIQQV